MKCTPATRAAFLIAAETIPTGVTAELSDVVVENCSQCGSSLAVQAGPDAEPGSYTIRVLGGPYDQASSDYTDVPVSIYQYPAPEITLKANNQQGSLAITSGTQVGLWWDTLYADSCSASASPASSSWSGSKSLSGTKDMGALTQGIVYTLSCSGPGGDSQASVAVSIIQQCVNPVWNSNTSGFFNLPGTICDNSTYDFRCDFGVQTDNISAPTGCAWDRFVGTAAQFKCFFGSIAPSSQESSDIKFGAKYCTINQGGSGNICYAETQPSGGGYTLPLQNCAPPACGNIGEACCAGNLCTTGVCSGTVCIDPGSPWPPPSPTLNASVSCAGAVPTVNLAWNSVPGAADYHIRRCKTSGCDPQPPAIKADSASPYADAGVANGEIDRYTVLAHDHVNALFSDPSNTVEMRPSCVAPATNYFLGRVYWDVNENGTYEGATDRVIETLSAGCSFTNKYAIDGFSVNVAGPVNYSNLVPSSCNADGGFYSSVGTAPNGTYTVTLNPKPQWTVVTQNPVTVNAAGNDNHIWFGVKPNACPLGHPADQFRGCWYDARNLGNPPSLPDESTQFPLYRALTPAGLDAQTINSSNPVLDYTWGNNDYIGPDQNGNNTGLKDLVLALWRGKIDFPYGKYIFHAISDDGVRLVFDGTNLISNGWKMQGPTQYDTAASIFGGKKKIRLEWYERTGSGRIKFWWDYQSLCDPKFSQDIFHVCAFDSTTGGNAPPLPDENSVSPLAEADDSPKASPVISGTTGSYTFFDYNWTTGNIWQSGKTDDVMLIWRGSFDFTAGSYVFHAFSNDGVRLYIDGVEKTLTDPSGVYPIAWSNHPGIQYDTASLSLSGRHDIRIDYYEDQSNARLKFWVDKTGGMSCTEAHPNATFAGGKYYVPASQSTVQVIATGVQNAGGVRFPTWSLKNGQDDLSPSNWYDAARQVDGTTWTGTVNFSNHNSGNDYGAYGSHAYLYENAADPYDAADKQFCDAADFYRVIALPASDAACPLGKNFTAINIMGGSAGVALSPPSLEYSSLGGGRLIIATRRTNNQIWVKEIDTAGGVLADWRYINGTTIDSPKLVYEGSNLAMYVKGTDAGKLIWKSTYTGAGNNWSGWTSTGISYDIPEPSGGFTDAFGPAGPTAVQVPLGEVYRVRGTSPSSVEVNTCGAVSDAGNGAQCVLVNVPSAVETSGVFDATVQMKNIGPNIWSAAESSPGAGDEYKLGAVDSAIAPFTTIWRHLDNSQYDRGLIPNTIPGYPNVATGGTVAFILTDIKAPSTAGSYDFAWQMVRESNEWFGEKCDASTKSTNITVGDAPRVRYESPIDAGIVSNPSNTGTVNVALDWTLLNSTGNPTAQSEYTLEVMLGDSTCSDAGYADFELGCLNLTPGFRAADGNGARIGNDAGEDGSVTQKIVTLDAGLPYKWRIKSKDSTGINAAYTAELERTFSIKEQDSVPPTVVITTPPDGFSTVNDFVAVSGNASDDVGVTTITCTITDSLGTHPCPTPTFTAGAQNTTWNIPSVSLPVESGIIITITATDDAGRSTSESVTITRRLPQCSDNSDNDGNGDPDQNDPDCHTNGIPSDGSSYDPNIDDEGQNIPPDFTFYHDPKDEQNPSFCHANHADPPCLDSTGATRGHFFSDMRIGTSPFSTETILIIVPNESFNGDVVVSVVNLQADNLENITNAADCPLSIGAPCQDGKGDGTSLPLENLLYLLDSTRRISETIPVVASTPKPLEFKVGKKEIATGRYIVTVRASGNGVTKETQILLVVGDNTSGYIER